jgi:hypothetical protein
MGYYFEYGRSGGGCYLGALGSVFVRIILNLSNPVVILVRDKILENLFY